MALADLANIVLHPDIKLPVQVYHEKKTTTDVTINCLESDDLQGFKPLSKSSIGDVSDHFRGEVRVPRGMYIDPAKYAKETLSRVEYVCEMNFDPLARLHIFSK